MPYSEFLILDLDSGTFFCADGACLIDWAALSADERETFCEGTDTERLLIADLKGLPIPRP